MDLISCSKTTSGEVSSSHVNRLGRRALMPLMLNDAIFMAGLSGVNVLSTVN